MQQKCVECTEGPLLILAGAGSGKTTVLVNRIAYLLESGKCDGYNILAITFTNKAARELALRIENRVGDKSDITAKTFHSFCVMVLRRNAKYIGYTSDFSIYDTDDSLRVIKDILKQKNIDEKTLPPRAILKYISKAKDMRIDEDAFLNVFGDNYITNKALEIMKVYNFELKNANALDFDDIILKTVELFENNREVLSYYQNRFKYIMVDEYQDTNPLQYMLIKLIANRYNNICVVGDDDQSIYKFRGATVENILSFEKTYKNAKVIRLEQNYRSTKNILSAANDVIANNEHRHEKKLWTDNESGSKIYENLLDSEYYESLFIADTILNSITNDGANYNDFAVLYRTNAQSNNIEKCFVKSGIPYKIIGSTKFYDRKEIKDALAYLYVINNHNDSIRLKRIINEPKRKIGKTTIERLEQIASGQKTSIFEVMKNSSAYPELSKSQTQLCEFVDVIENLSQRKDEITLCDLTKEMLMKTGYMQALVAENTPESRDRIENLAELVSSVVEFEKNNEGATLAMFLEEIALMSDVDNLEESNEKVVMMTLHSAKGLEFNTVFLAGLEDGLFPSQRSIDAPGEVEEERRLMYVGITRAKKRLYLTHTRQRMLYGQTIYNKPSRFLKEINPNLIEKLYSEHKGFNEIKTKPLAFNPKANAVKKEINKAPLPDFKAGNRVLHKTFGEGLVLNANKMGNDVLLEIAFDNVGTKKLMATFAKLEIIE